MSNECRRVITPHAFTDIHRRLQEENISISHQAIDTIFLENILSMVNRVESGSDDLDNLGHLGHLFVGQVGLFHKPNYLDVTQISHVF